MLEARRVNNIPVLAIEWESARVNPELPTGAELINLFDSSTSTTDQFEEHVKCVWAGEAFIHTDSQNLMVRIAAKPVDLTELNLTRNKLKLKHAMLGAMLWDSLTSNFQLEIIRDDSDFKQGQDYNRLRLWQYIQKEANLSTMTGASGFKDKIESKMLNDFKHDIKDVNT